MEEDEVAGLGVVGDDDEDTLVEIGRRFVIVRAGTARRAKVVRGFMIALVLVRSGLVGNCIVIVREWFECITGIIVRESDGIRSIVGIGMLPPAVMAGVVTMRGWSEM